MAGISSGAPKDILRGTLGVSMGPESVVLVSSGAYDTTDSVQFGIVGPVEGVEVTIHATAKSATPSVTFTLAFWNESSSSWIDYITTAALTDAGDVYILVSHHATATTNVAAQRLVRERLRITATHADGDALTFSITATAI